MKHAIIIGGSMAGLASGRRVLDELFPGIFWHTGGST